MTQTLEEATVRLADEFGTVLAGRGLASRLSQRVAECVRAGNVAIVDFAGVQVVSPSFADELFAKMPEEIARHVTFENVGDDLLALAKFVRDGRGSR